ncbi:TOK1 [[Candida] subhashii]|uniref:TOK1 n=1 Tax=[Candida] subhashii TaxID=561895 RepID=A0A8J5Q978_9ASCO|nr:TOK1 [[Candida] subhashii]KAG7663059.1 TOK1 [[Candida] subhashii]
MSSTNKFKESIHTVKSQLQPHQTYFTKLTQKRIENYQDKLTPLLHHNYEIAVDTDHSKTNPPVDFSNVLEVPMFSIINLRVQPGDDYFVLWFLISSYFPLIVACLGPLANMLGIISIMEKWKFDSVSQKLIKDDNKVIIMNSISLALGILGNVSLLMNFSGTVKYLISQCISIISWFCASIFLVAGILIANKRLEGQAGRSEGFYFIILLHFIIPNHWIWKYRANKCRFSVYVNEFLTPDQAFHKMRHIRTRVKSNQIRISLLIISIIFIGFWLLGALVFSTSENWTYFEGVYFCFMTLLTIGYGDFVPETSFGRMVFVCWAIGAVPLMTILVSDFGDELYELSNHTSYLFSKWIFKRGVEEHEVDHFKKRQREEEQSSDDESSVESKIVDSDQRPDEEEELETLEEESDPNAILQHLHLQAKRHNQKKLGILKSSAINRAEEKKKAHEDLLIFLEKLKPLITASIENPLKKYNQKKWEEILEVLDHDEIEAIRSNEKVADGFWLSDNSPLRLPLKEPNYLILRLYFKIEESLKNLVDAEIEAWEQLDQSDGSPVE